MTPKYSLLFFFLKLLIIRFFLWIYANWEFDANGWASLNTISHRFSSGDQHQLDNNFSSFCLIILIFKSFSLLKMMIFIFTMMICVYLRTDGTKINESNLNDRMLSVWMGDYFDYFDSQNFNFTFSSANVKPHCKLIFK